MAWIVVYGVLFFILILVEILNFRHSRKERRKLKIRLKHYKRMCNKADEFLKKLEKEGSQ